METQQDLLQLEFLKRQWAMLDEYSHASIRVPALFSGAILSFSSFMVTNAPQATSKTAFVAIAIFLFALIGLLINATMHRSYRIYYKRIGYIYDVLGMRGPKFRHQERDDGESKTPVFVGGYIIIAASGILCSIGVVFLT